MFNIVGVRNTFQGPFAFVNVVEFVNGQRIGRQYRIREGEGIWGSGLGIAEIDVPGHRVTLSTGAIVDIDC